MAFAKNVFIGSEMWHDLLRATLPHTQILSLMVSRQLGRLGGEGVL